MRFTTTAGRAVAVALAAAALGLGATTSAQAVTTGGTPITNGSCSVLVESMNGSLVVQSALTDNGGCYLSIFDSTSGILLEGPATLSPHKTLVYVGLSGKLTGCLTSALTGTRVCDPIN
ncbi:hypothetical protein ACFZB9_07375 [Kitasatospora sp. NPDC008050]|uniref:hypothetical protein n=1 Tax=Kitasatospora sp. NPDC008050 TaxID=3364021 RepID=UPI0036E9667D